MSQEQMEAATPQTTPETQMMTEMEPPQPAVKEASLTEMLARRDAAENRAFKEDGGDPNAAPEADPADATEAPTDAPAETPVEAPAADPNDELATLRAQNELLLSVFGDDITKQLNPESAAPAAPTTPDGQQEDLLARRTFELTDDEIDKIYVENDAETIKAVEKRRFEVLEHNMRLDNNVSVANAVMWFMPVALATKAFNDRNPEFAAWPKAGEMISTALLEARQANPGASELQLLRKAEQRLEPLIKKCKTIIAQGAQGKKDVGASQSPTAKTPAPRAVVPSAPRPSREPSTEDRVAELRQYAAQNNYVG